MESASLLIDERIMELRGRRGKMLAQIQAIQHEAAPESVDVNATTSSARDMAYQDGDLRRAIDSQVAALNSAAKP